MSPLLALALAFGPLGLPPLVAGPPPTALDAALKAARERPGAPFRLGVLCGNRDVVRQMEVYPSGLGTWDDRVQVSIPPEARVALVEELLARGFAALAPSYGGREEPAAPEAALRVTCRVSLGIGGLEKTSVQLAYGEQSAELAALASALLDRVQPLAASGVAARDLGDGLARVAEGTLTPELLGLRLVRLPPGPTEAVGSILRLEEGRASRRAYAPGREIGEEIARELPAGRVREIATELRKAEVQELPVNLWSESQIELEVGVLGHRKVVLARPFRRLVPGQPAEAHRRFERALKALRGLESTLLP